MKELVFILSLPRSGSTLLHRILKCSSEVECPAEPWVLIPALNLIEKKYEECSEYNSISSRRAYNDLINYCGKENYINALNIFYTKVVQEEAYEKDLHEGYISLQRFKTKHLGNRNVMSIAYEDIVEDDFDWESVFNFLNINLIRLTFQNLVIQVLKVKWVIRLVLKNTIGSLMAHEIAI